MNKRELGESITKNEKRFAACEDIVNLLESAIGILRVAKKRQGTVYESVANGEYSAEMLTVIGDLMSMKKEYSDIASEIADDIETAKRKREDKIKLSDNDIKSIRGKLGFHKAGVEYTPVLHGENVYRSGVKEDYNGGVYR